jgi:cytochrome c biogenesis protein CcmG, thiol:disulfide interchange protein DsbE
MKLDRVLQILIGVLLVALVVVVSGSLNEKVVVAGDNAPNFNVKTDTGLEVSRANFGGKVLVLNFWATWCPPCVEEIPSLNEMQKQLGGSGVVVLAVSVDKNEQAYRQFLQRAGVSFQTVRDPEANVSADYGTFKYPETYVIDRSGKVVQKIIGPTDWTDPKMISYIRSLL